jgi:hypothetical protein
MDTVLLVLAAIGFLFWVPSALEMALGFRRVPLLDREEPLADDACPTLSIVVPACNEAETVEPAMRSLLAVEYPRLEIVAVDDRSTDATGAILDRLAAEDARLRVVHLTELPPGWLGKNHALMRGSEAVTGEWLLFTDADVVYQPDALRRAVGLAVREGCDHLVVYPHMVLEGFWERTFVGFFMVMFNFRFRTWQAAWKRAPGYVGVGAFSMLRTRLYRELGGHQKLRMEVGDDIKLGKVVKRSGARQVLAVTHDRLAVRWVVGLRGAIHGLSKNAFAGVDYSWLAAVASCVMLVCGCVWPFLGLFVGPGLARGLCAAEVAAMVLAAWAMRASTRIPIAYVLAWPLAALLFAYILLRSAVLTQRQGGVYWRGTFYPLEELRRHLV